MRTKKQAQKQPKKPRLDSTTEAEDVMEVVAPTRRPVAATPGGVGLDETLTDDALVAVCRHVHAGADLVRLSCVSRTLHRLIAHPTDGAPVWRELFRRERGPAAYAAMSALVQLHGADAVRHVFVADRENLLQAMAGGAGEAAAALPQRSVWCEAFIETDEKLAWRRLLADVASDRAGGLEELAKATALMKFRDTVETRIAAWIGDDEADNEDDDDEDDDKNEEESHHEKKKNEDQEEKAEKKESEDDEDDEEKEKDGDDEDDNDDEDDEDEDKLARSEPKLETNLQKMQVRMLLNMMRVTKHNDFSCGDDYRGIFGTSRKNVTLGFLRDNTVSSVESSGGDGQYNVTTCKISLSVGGKAHGRVWEYATNSARDDNPACSPKSCPQLQKLWEELLKPSADSDEGLTFRHFLHFLGVALDLAHEDDYERGYTAFHSFLDLAPA